jgi:hypothetical protein
MGAAGRSDFVHDHTAHPALVEASAGKARSHFKNHLVIASGAKQPKASGHDALGCRGPAGLAMTKGDECHHSPSTDLAMIVLWTSLVPPKIVQARLLR